MARRIKAAAFVSLDGIMQAPGGTTEDPTGGFLYGGWLVGVSDEAIDEAIGPLFVAPFALLLGRRTYDIFAAYWPYAPAEDPIAAAFAKADKFVMTRGSQRLDWEGSHRVGSVADLAAIKRQDGPDLVIQGSSTLYPALLGAGLIDELTLLTAPIILGQGKRLLGHGDHARQWRMVSHTVGSKGCIAARYVPAGAVTNGSFGEQGPNPREEDRQRRMKEGRW